MKYWLTIFLLMLSPLLTEAATCITHGFPNEGNDGGQLFVDPGLTYFTYSPPPGALPTGLEFWMHFFPSDVPKDQMYILWYLNNAYGHGRRMGMAFAGYGTEHGVVNFPLSTFVHPGESFVVVIGNSTGVRHNIYLTVTYRECWP